MSQPGYYPPPYPGAVPPQPQRVRPSGWWIVAGVVVMVLGIAGAVAVGVAGFVQMSDKVDNFQRVTFPNTGELRLEAAHDYTVYLEYPGAGSSRPGQAARARLTDPSGQIVHLENYTADENYSFGDHHGRAEFSFRSTQAGTYRLETDGSSDITAAVGDGLGSSIVSTILIALAIGAIGFVLGLVIIVVVIVRRSRSRRQPTGF
ncbi:hypothetical protein GPX89_38375 [Nocardia sp. ET3-3]|uniref:Uncharacterized protein n=1 Tax=Nocardia terrae TaxID=2675851 RepID=A0A7K1V8W2_9NOCA|nr:hypothetical protein [Nocardia terrae]MVU83093.1 hypothetical protein [Nocardia terrae]